MTRTLQISLLGDVVIQLGDSFVTGLPSRAAEALLIYLVRSPRPVAREKLAELLWADRTSAQALTNLRTILTPLRRELGDYLVVTRQTLAFDHSRAHWLDVAEFEQGWARLDLAQLALPDAGRAQQLQTVLDLYQGDFLEGFYLKGGQGFEEWATLERERLRHLAREGFRLLASYQLEIGDYSAGVVTAARWRRLDPYSEEACRTHMWLLTRAGQPHLAAQAYQELRRTLQADLDVEPGASTASLFECVQGAHFPPPLDLPPAATAFIGREAELDALARLLLARDSRLLTLAGPGGIGKTRLAIEAARTLGQRLPGRFLNGVRFVPLAALKSPQSLPSHIASVLGVELQGTAPPRQQLLAYLAAREILLILDNFEHLLDDQGEAIAFLVDLLRQAPMVKLLLTSRERLGLYEEVIVDVPGLDTPDEGEGEAPLASAARLFVEAGRRVRRDFAPDAAELRCIARACRMVEGVPLAIELAASWLRHYSCPQIVQQIQHSLDFLASDYRDLPERQRSLRSVFEYSWQLLAPEEQSALVRLAVFSGGFSPEAADAIAGPRAPLADLADKSLLQGLPAGRFDLHPLLRVYAAEKLALNPPAQVDITDRHAAFYLDHLTAQGGGESPEQRGVVRQELANIRCAWEWAAQRGMVEPLSRAAATMHGFYSVQSWFQEGIDLFAWTLAVLGDEECSGDCAALRGELLGRKARMHIHIGQLAQARADVQQALVDLPQIEDPRRRSSVLDSLAISRYYAGDYAEAAALAEESLRLSELGQDEDGIGFALNFLGSCAKALGDYACSRAYFQRAAERYLRLRDDVGAAMVFNNLGNLAQASGDWEDAQRYYQQSGELFKAHEHEHGMATALANLGRLACKRGSYDEARALLGESLRLKRAIGDGRGAAVALAGLGEVGLARGAYTEARMHLLDALDLAHQTGDVKLLVEVMATFAELLAKQGRDHEAVRLAVYTLQHQGASQEAREHAERLAQELGPDAQGADAGWQDERAMLDWLRLL
jgi:predicted ATPase/DNA-binding SARP family transcriptional activator